jgi:hypothetical protein
MNQPKPAKVIFWGGLIAGTLDITAACVVSWLRSGVRPVIIMQSVASGLLGAPAYQGGAKTAALGVVLHYFIATMWTVVFYVASRKLRFLIARPITWGLVYGVIVYVLMNFVVLPVSAFPQRTTPTLTSRIINLVIIMLCIGLPIALITRRFSRQS